MNQRVLIVGCGGLGGVLSAALLEHPLRNVEPAQGGRPGGGLEVVSLTTNPTIAKALRERGFRVRGVDGPREVAGDVRTELASNEAPFDFIVLAAQPPQVEEAARSAAPYLAENGAMVCLQNGLCEERVARIVGVDHVIGAVVGWGGAMPEPGLYERTSAGGFTLGALQGAGSAMSEKIARLTTIFEPVGPVLVTDNLAGSRWSKLAINCCISTLGTLGGARLGTLMLHRIVRRLGLEIMTEVVHVAHAERVRLEKVSGTIDLDWIALTESERKAAGSPGLLAKHSMLLAVGARYRRMRSSMLAAIERGRPPAVDFLNGEVVDRGKTHHIPTPYNAEARKLVHMIARGERKPGLELIHELERRVEGSRAVEARA